MHDSNVFIQDSIVLETIIYDQIEYRKLLFRMNIMIVVYFGHAKIGPI